jgi:putative transcriptional regulator
VSEDSLKGQLLIAAPLLLDPNFRRTVVLVLEHTSEGALGLVLNRPSETAASDVLPELSGVIGAEPVYVGGPVQPDAVIALAELPDTATGDGAVFGPIASIDAGTDPDELRTLAQRVRVFAGYAGWGEGQLDAELEEEAWFTDPAHPDDVFEADAESLWRAVLERKGGSFRLVSRMPDDPRMN